MTIPNVFGAGTIDYNELNENFDELWDATQAVGNAQLSGGITADKLSDRFAFSTDTIQILENTSDDDLQSPAEFILSTARTEMFQWQPILDDSMELHVCGMAIYVKSVTNAGGVYAGLEVLLNGTGTPVGGLVHQLTGNEVVVVANTTPLSSPICVMTNGHYLQFLLGSFTGVAPAVTARGIKVVLSLKHVLVR